MNFLPLLCCNQQMHNNTFLKVGQKQPVTSRKSTGNNIMLGFELTADGAVWYALNLLTEATAVFSHACVWPVIWSSTVSHEVWFFYEPLRFMLSELSHTDPIFLLFSAHKTRAVDYGPYMPYYRMQAFVWAQKHNTSVKHRHSHMFTLCKAPITNPKQQACQCLYEMLFVSLSMALKPLCGSTSSTVYLLIRPKLRKHCRKQGSKSRKPAFKMTKYKVNNECPVTPEQHLQKKNQLV